MLFRSLLNEEPEQDNGNPPLPADGEEGGLWRWILLSGVLHLGVIAIVLLVPHTPFSRTINYPVYTVELVGSEKIGGGTPITAIETSPLPPSKPKPVKSKPAVTVKTEVPPKPLAPKKTVKETAKKAKTPAVALVKKPAKRKKLKNKVQRAPRKKAPKKTLRAEVSKSPSRTSQSTAGEAREKMIMAAVERVKRRAEAERAKKKNVGGGGGGNGGGGTVGSGKNGSGGGVLKGFEFLVYRNRMLTLIKKQWTWVGKVTDLEVTVRFGILENGEVVGLRVVEASGDPSYDDSVLRAMRKAAPLPPPPDDYRSDFMNVELTFRPKDLRG